MSLNVHYMTHFYTLSIWLRLILNFCIYFVTILYTYLLQKSPVETGLGKVKFSMSLNYAVQRYVGTM